MQQLLTLIQSYHGDTSHIRKFYRFHYRYWARGSFRDTSMKYSMDPMRFKTRDKSCACRKKNRERLVEVVRTVFAFHVKVTCLNKLELSIKLMNTIQQFHGKKLLFVTEYRSSGLTCTDKCLKEHNCKIFLPLPRYNMHIFNC